MSEKAQAAALDLDLPGPAREMMARALKTA
jgi:hypothetical protein